MGYNFPFTIDSGHGEKIIFKELVNDPEGDKIMIEGHCEPKAGPPMHVHYRQDEGFTVVKGKAGYQFQGKEPVYLSPGDSILFPRNQPHRFWNAGEDELVINSWARPANNIVFFLATLYGALKKSKTERPEAFDSAFLMVRYKSEFGLIGLPGFVKKVIIPATYRIGVWRGKYKKFKDAPDPLK